MRKLMFYIVVLALGVSMMDATVIFDQDFNVSSPPAGWSIAGYVGTSHTTDGTAKTDANLFKNDGGANYLRLTENAGYNRAWAYYTAQTIDPLGKWQLTAEIRIGKTHNGAEITSGADGMCFVFINAADVRTNGNFDPSKVIGGYGEFEGAPRGGLPNTPVNGAVGYHAGLRGFSLEHDHYQNSPELFREYIHWVDLNDWVHSGLGMNMDTETAFYYNDGWQRIQVEGNAGVITYRYKWNGSSYDGSFTMDTLNPSNANCDDLTSFDAYFGIAAATGGETAFHEVRNVKFEVEDDTLPVELSSFTATQNSTTSAQINWVTQSETNVNGFSIYRATEADLATAITVSPLIPATNTATMQSYHYTDNELYESGVYYYWLQVQDLGGTSDFHGPTTVNFQTGDNPGVPDVPITDGISSVYPNPFNPSTTISYGLEKSADVHFSIYNSRGQLVRSFSENHKAAGNWKTYWNGLDNSGNACSSGVYQIIMKAGSSVTSRKAVLMK